MGTPIKDIDNCTATEIARVFKKTSGAVGLWHSRDKCPRNPNARYSLPEIVDWVIARECAKSEKPLVGDGSPALERQREARARMSELDLAEREGRIIPLEEHKAEVIRVAQIFKSSVVTMPAMLAPRLAGMSAREIMARLKGWVHDTCNALAVGSKCGKGSNAKRE